MANRTFTVILRSEGKLDAGTYKTDVEFVAELNQEELLSDLAARIADFAASANGVCEGSVRSFPTPARIQYNCTYAFLNLESMLYFAQAVPFPQRTRSIAHEINYTSLIALI